MKGKSFLLWVLGLIGVVCIVCNALVWTFNFFNVQNDFLTTIDFYTKFGLFCIAIAAGIAWVFSVKLPKLVKILVIILFIVAACMTVLSYFHIDIRTFFKK